jgi:acyl carrier protein phosphodiesterase
MNLLAHSYLSFNDPELLVGNMISDYVKGRKKFDYLQGIQNGIALHRAIDIFTDVHPATKAAKEFLKPAVGAYSGAFIDVVYDHFLANDTNEFVDGQLERHAGFTYEVLQEFSELLPPPFQQMVPYMVSQNWLANYKQRWGIERSFGGVVRRAKYLQSSESAFRLFETHYAELQKCYNDFFPDLKAHARLQFQLLQKT